MSQFICIGKKNRKDLPLTFMKQKGEGFTIIELLVVIAIIGVLAAIVLVQTGTAKKKGQDAVIQSALREVRNAAELYYNNPPFTYEGVCDTGDDTLANNGDFKRIEDYINQHNGPDGVIGCHESENGYAVISSLNLGNCWCVDSEGASQEVELESGDCGAKLTGITCPD